jgi:uncharacterized protein (TIGR01244 family)
MPALPALMELAPGLTATGALTADHIEALAASGVKTIINNRPDDEDPGQFPAGEARRLAEAHGMTYIHIPMTAATLHSGDVDAMEQAVKNSPQPIVAHCRSGTRTTLLWALGRVRAGEDPAALVALGARNGVDIAVLPVLAQRLL